MTPQPMPGRGAALAAIIMLAVLPYLNALGSDFVIDDRGQILFNDFVRNADLKALLSSDYWAGFGGRVSGLYRPLTSLSFALDHALWNDEPLPYHLTNIFLHVLCSLLVYALAARLLHCVRARADDDRETNDGAPSSAPRSALLVPLLSALVFAVHPIHSEAVIGIVGRADLFATAFVLLGLWASLSGVRTSASPSRRTTWLHLIAALALALGLLAKEHALVLPGLVAASHGWLHRQGRLRAWAWREYGLYAAVLAAYLGARWLVLGGFFTASVDVLDNPLAPLPLPWRWINALAIGGRYVALLAFPQRLSVDYSLGAFPVSRALLSLETGAALAGVLGTATLVLRCWRTPTWPCLATAWFLISMAPVANLLMPIGTIMAERLLYLPSVGIALLTGWLLAALTTGVPPTRPGPRILRPAHRYNPAGTLATVVLLLVFAARTWERGPDWHDNGTIFRAACGAYPGSARAHQGRGEALLERGDAIGALQCFTRALTIHPGFYAAHYNTGVAYLRLHRFAPAVTSFERAVALKPDSAPALLNLGAAWQRQGQWNAAVTAYRRAVASHPRYVPAWQNLADLEWARGNRQAACQAAAELLRLQPRHPRAAEYREWMRRFAP